MKTRTPDHIIVIRPATLEDIPTVIELNRAGILSWARGFQPIMQEWMDSVCTPSYFEEKILNPKKTLLIADFNGKTIGTAYGYPKERRFYTGGMYVSVNGKGVATLLIRELVRQAQSLGLNELCSEVHEENHGALRFFHRQGWGHKSTESFEGLNFYNMILLLSQK